MALSAAAQSKLVIHFNHFANGKKLQRGVEYDKAFGEKYTLKQLKYYITAFQPGNGFAFADAYLIDAFGEDSVVLILPSTKIKNIRLGFGVDSTRSVSGVQSDALDPLHGMFWTWNTGYINYKIEGESEQSTFPTKKFEYHLGGFANEEKTQMELVLQFKKTKLRPNKTYQLNIQFDLDRFWKKSSLEIAALPMVSKPGANAVHLANAFVSCFTANSISIVNEK